MPSVESPGLAIVMCTRDGARHVEAQLVSILEQTARPDQLVVRDDDSRDSTVALIRAVASGAPFAVSIESNATVLGPRENFEVAIQQAEADIVVLADQDDVWEPERLAVIASVFASDPSVSAVFSDASLIDDDGRLLPGTLWDAVGLRGGARRSVLAGNALQQLCRWNVVTGATLAFRRSLIPLLVPFPPRGMHDYWIALVAAATGTVRAIDEPLVRYRLHAANAVGVPSHDPRALVAARRADVDARRDELAVVSSALERTAALASREARALLAEKQKVLVRRAALDGTLFSRLPTVTALLLTGRYHRLAHGWRSAGHDLLIGR